MKLTSDQFQNNEMIPGQYTCMGEDINPSLKIEDIPDEAESLVLIVDDLDAPQGTFTHWVVYDIPLTSYIHENSVPGTVGTNDYRHRSYGGPCPTSGIHHYHFKVYAIDLMLDLPGGQTKAQVENVIRGHIIAEAELIGLFTKEEKEPVRR